MKGKFFILPTFALILVAIWIGSERRSTTLLEKRSSLLKEALAARASGSGTDTAASKPKSPDQLAKEKGPVDWKKVAAQLAEMREAGGMGDMRTYLRLQQKFSAMSKEELVSALDEIATLDMPDESRQMLQQLLLGPLCEKDPEYALTRYFDRVDDQNGMMSWRLASAMRDWAGKDPAAATAWFDQQIAAGKFDSKSLDGESRPRQQFEGALINVLLASDPDAAGRRLGAIPEDQRRDVLMQYQFQSLKEESQLAFAKLIRSQVPADEQADTLAQQASHLGSREGYSKVTEYLDRIEATPTERAKCAEEAAESKLRNQDGKKVTRENLDEMREWVTTQAPEALASITGKSLGTAMQGRQKMEFSEVADLALQYNQISGNDDVLTNFLESWPARENKEQARALAEKITDEKRREEILKDLE